MEEKIKFPVEGSFYKLNSDNKIELHIPGKSSYMALPENIKSDIKKGFIWGRQRGAWVSRSKGGNIPWSMTKYEITYHGADKLANFEDIKEREAERAANKAERFAGYAKNAEKRSEQLKSEFNKYRKDWSWLTQPITPGAGGQAFKRHKERVMARYDKGMEEAIKANNMAEYAKSLEIRSEQKELKDQAYLQLRIKENEKIIKKIPEWEKYYEDKVKSGNLSDQDLIWLDGQMNRVRQAVEKYNFFKYHLDNLINEKKEKGVFFDEEAAKKSIKKDFKAFLKKHYGLNLLKMQVAYKAKGPVVYLYRTDNDLPPELHSGWAAKNIAQKSIVYLLAFMNKIENEKKESEVKVEKPIEQPEIKGNRLFSDVKTISRDLITTDAKTFQGRQHEFAQETVDKIVREGFDKSQDPIIVWFDPEKKKYIVISGHSRWEASNRLFDKGQKDLAEMPVKVFLGDKDDAIDYAVLESNRSGTAEGLKSDLSAYKRAVEKGYNKERLLGLFKPESYLSLLKDISNLNPKGLFIQYLDSASEQSFPYLKRNAQWVGTLRKMYPKLTDAHEKEMFDYIYKGTGLKLNKTDFFKLIDRKVMVIDFDPEKALNLNNVVSSSAITDPAKEKLAEITEQIKKFERERQHKEELIVRAKKENMADMVKKFQDQVSDINKAILRKIEERTKVESEIRQIETATTFDLFSAPAPEEKPEVSSPPQSEKAKEPEKMPEPIKFEIGSTYKMGFIGDAELFVYYTVLKRSDKTVTVQQDKEKPVTKKIFVRDNAEYIFPLGQYSMAPILDASRKESKPEIKIPVPAPEPIPEPNKEEAKVPEPAEPAVMKVVKDEPKATEATDKKVIASHFNKSQRAALKRKIELTVEELEKMKDPDHVKLLRIAMGINAERSLYSQLIDNPAVHAKRLPVTLENVIRWAKHPGRYDLIGVDTPNIELTATAGLRSLKKIADKAKVMNLYKIVK